MFFFHFTEVFLCLFLIKHRWFDNYIFRNVVVIIEKKYMLTFLCAMNTRSIDLTSKQKVSVIFNNYLLIQLLYLVIIYVYNIHICYHLISITL